MKNYAFKIFFSRYILGIKCYFRKAIIYACQGLVWHSILKSLYLGNFSVLTKCKTVIKQVVQKVISCQNKQRLIKLSLPNLIFKNFGFRSDFCYFLKLQFEPFIRIEIILIRNLSIIHIIFMNFYTFYLLIVFIFSATLAPSPNGNSVIGNQNSLIYCQENLVQGNNNGLLNSRNNQIAGSGNAIINSDGNFVMGQENSIINSIQSISCLSPKTNNQIQLPIKIALRVKGNGKFVSAQNSGKDSLIANRDIIGPWETFNVIDLGNNNVAFQSIINAMYVSTVSDGITPLIANKVAIGSLQTFLIQQIDGGVALKSQADNQYVSVDTACQHILSNKKIVGPFETFTLVKFYDIAIISVSNGKFVTTESGGAAPLIANRVELGPWEKFSLIELGDSKAAIQSKNNEQYVCAEGAGSSPLIANRGVIGPWQTFTIVQMQKGIALRSQANAKFVSSVNNGGSSLIASKDRAGIQQTFQLLYI